MFSQIIINEIIKTTHFTKKNSFQVDETEWDHWDRSFWKRILSRNLMRSTETTEATHFGRNVFLWKRPTEVTETTYFYIFNETEFRNIFFCSCDRVRLLRLLNSGIFWWDWMRPVRPLIFKHFFCSCDRVRLLRLLYLGYFLMRLNETSETTHFQKKKIC